METGGSATRRAAATAGAAVGRLAGRGSRALERTLGGAERTRIIVLLASVLALSSADASTVGASATELRHALHINNTDIGLLVSVTSLVAAAASLPFGVLADRVRRTWFLGLAIVLWGIAMIWSPTVPDFAQQLARERRIEPEPELVLTSDPRRMGFFEATRYILRVRTNVVLILASALGYYFLAGVQTFGVEFTTHQYGINQALANLLLLVVGAGAIAGVLAGGSIGDRLLHRGYLNGRIIVSAIAAARAVVLFIPAIFTHSALSAVPYLIFAALAISAQNPPLDAARLDIMVPLLWGRAEGVRTFLRTTAQALAPLLFGAVSDYVFGGGHNGLKWTFAVMLLPLAASAYFLFRGLRTYPRDVATAAAASDEARRALPASAG